MSSNDGNVICYISFETDIKLRFSPLYSVDKACRVTESNTDLFSCMSWSWTNIGEGTCAWIRYTTQATLPYSWFQLCLFFTTWIYTPFTLKGLLPYQMTTTDIQPANTLIHPQTYCTQINKEPLCLGNDEMSSQSERRIG